MHNRKRELGRKARSCQVNSLDFSFMFRKLPNPRRKSNLGESQTLVKVKPLQGPPDFRHQHT
jgi:hypothetical protein